MGIEKEKREGRRKRLLFCVSELISNVEIEQEKKKKRKRKKEKI